MTEIDAAFLRPEVLWALPGALVAVLAWRRVRRRRSVAFSALLQFERLRHRPSRLRRLPWLLTVVAFALALLALAEPVLPYAESTVEARGLDIVLVLDLSSSMGEITGLQSDLAPAGSLAVRAEMTRLEVTKQALRDFIQRRREDRIGLVVFATTAYVISPLTFDYEYLLRYVDEITGDLRRETAAGHVIVESGTAIGEGIHLANALLARQSTADARNKVLVVFTDGEHNSGRDPVDALDATEAAGVRVHLIGIELESATTDKPAVRSLIGAVRRQGGQYFQANSGRQLQAANRTLTTLEKGHLVGKRFELNVPIFTWFATPALILVVAALGLRAIPYFADLT